MKTKKKKTKNSLSILLKDQIINLELEGGGVCGAKERKKKLSFR